MNLEYFINPKQEKDTIHFGKHQIRFKMQLVKELGLKDGDIVKIGIDQEESPCKHFYIVLTDGKSNGFKITKGNGTILISSKGLYDKLQMQSPQNCKYEIVNFPGEVRAIKVRFVTPLSKDSKQ